MALEFDKRTFEGLMLAEGVNRSNEERKNQENRLVDLIRRYIPETVNLSNNELLGNPEFIKLAVNSAKELRIYEYTRKREETLDSIPRNALENLVLIIPPHQTKDNVRHNKIYYAHREYLDTVTLIENIQNGGDGSQKTVKDYATAQTNKAKAEVSSNLDSIPYLKDEDKRNWIDLVSRVVEQKYSDPRVVLAELGERAKALEGKLNSEFGEDYSKVNYAIANIATGVDKGGEDAQKAMDLADLMRYEGIDSPEKLAGYYKQGK